ncbi:MAG: DUF4136 domain-containing protein [Myxococcales bacterium]|nr:DUF4136 domain-containing protein [Myxococcales bacterium]
MSLFDRSTTPHPSTNEARSDTSAPLAFGLAAILGALALISGCASTPQVNHAADPELEPSSYATFRLVDHDVGHQGAEARISNTVHHTMALRGFEVARDATPADLLVSVKVLTAGALEPQSAQVGGGAANGLVGGVELVPFDVASQDAEVDKLVLVQLVDARTNRVVWVGWSQTRVRASQLEVAASEAVSKIMRRVPDRGFDAAG